MKSSFATHLIAAAALFGAVSQAQAEIKLSPDSSLFFTADASLAYNSNVLLSSANEKSDEVFDITPGLLATFGQGSEWQSQISYKEDFSEYFSNSDLNADLALADFTSVYDDGATKVNAGAFFHQVDQATRDVRGADSLIHRDVSNANLAGENSIDAKDSVKLGFSYDDTQYKSSGFTNWQQDQVFADYYFKVEPKLDLSAGVTYKDNELGNGGINSTELYYNVGARGELAPKLTGEFSVGYNTIDMDGRPTRSALGLESKFTYAADEKTNIFFGANNDNGYGADGNAYKNFGINGGFETVVSDQWKVGGQLSYGRYDYTTELRTDDFYQGQVSATYVVSREISVSVAYAYADNSSTLSGASFTDNILSISAKFRY